MGVVDGREAVPPQRNIEQPALRPVAAAGGGAAQEQAPLPHDREPVPGQQPDQQPAAATRVLVVGASSEDVSKAAVKQAWKARLRESAGKPPFNYKLADTTIALRVLANGQLSCAELGCAQPDFGISVHTRGERNAHKHVELHIKWRKQEAAASAAAATRRSAAPAGPSQQSSLRQMLVPKQVCLLGLGNSQLAVKSAVASPAALVSAELLPYAAGGFRELKSS